MQAHDERAVLLEEEDVPRPLGVDVAADDPESPLRISPAGFRAAGRRLGSLQLPTVLVQEGGYDLPRLGSLVLQVLDGFEEEHG